MRAIAVLFALSMLTATAPASASEHSWSVYARMGASAYSSPARTLAGIGGAVGVRWNRGLLVVQTEVGWITGLGNVFEYRIAAGIQRQATWSPAVLGTFALLAGDQLSILGEQRPLPVRGPAATLGVDCELLRFRHGHTRISAMQVGVGLGTDRPEIGVALRVGFFELAYAW